MTKGTFVKVGDICSTISETYKRKDETVFLVNTSDVLDGYFLQLKEAKNEKLKGQFKKTFKKDDILFSEIRPANRRFAYVDFDDTHNYVASTKLMVLRANSDVVLPKYLFYFLTSKNVLVLLQHLAETRSGTFPQITFSTEIAPLEMFLPEMDQQRKIVGYLDAVNKKIKNNDKLIAILFLQMDLMLRRTLSNSETRVGFFEELISDTLNGDWGKDQPTGNFTKEVYCVRGADIEDVRIGRKGKMPTRFILPKNYDAKKISPLDIVVEISGGSPTQSTGRAAIFTENLIQRFDKPLVSTNFCKVFKPINGFSYFVFLYWNQLYNKEKFFLYENGTTGIKNLDIKSIISKEEILIPSLSSLKELNSFCKMAFSKIAISSNENERLQSIVEDAVVGILNSTLRV